MAEIGSIGQELKAVEQGDLIRWNGRKNPQPVISCREARPVDFEVKSWRGSRFHFFIDNGEPTLQNLQSDNTYTITEFERIGKLYNDVCLDENG